MLPVCIRVLFVSMYPGGVSVKISYENVNNTVKALSSDTRLGTISAAISGLRGLVSRTAAGN